MIDGHGDDTYSYGGRIRHNFSSNVYNHTDHEGLYRHLAARMESVRRYPEPEPYTLQRRIAREAGIRPGNVCVTNGATEAIYLLAQLFGGACSHIVAPTFSEYADACRIHRHCVTFVPSLESIPDGAGEGLLWICNPNNPTGKVTDKERLRAFVSEHPHTTFVIDQSYESFTLLPLFTAREALEHPNVVLLHSMTKRFAIPGLRIGYITAQESMLESLRTIRMPWSVNALATEAALYLLDGIHAHSFPLEELLAETRRLAQGINRLEGIEALPTDTHFMLARLEKGRAADLKGFLADKHGILIRDASNFHGLDGRYFRIAAQSAEENDLLLKALQEWTSL